MYQEHESFIPPPRQTRIWRYFSTVEKFTSMLEQSGLFFARGDRFDDPFEGSLPRLNTETREQVYRELELSEDEKVLAREIIDTWSMIKRVAPKKVAISCWHMNEVESVAMWRGYGNKGVALSSTFEGLVAGLQGAADPIHIGVVRYEDYDRFVMPEWDFFGPLLRKRMPYEYERELRAIVRHFYQEPEQLRRRIEKGISVAVDLQMLIHAVHLPPGADARFAELIATLLSDHGLHVPILPSGMDAKPSW